MTEGGTDQKRNARNERKEVRRSRGATCYRNQKQKSKRPPIGPDAEKKKLNL